MVWKPQQNKQITMSLLVNCGVKRHALLTPLLFEVNPMPFTFHLLLTRHQTTTIIKVHSQKSYNPHTSSDKRGKKGIPKGKNRDPLPSIQVFRWRSVVNILPRRLQGPWLVGTIGLSAKRRPKAASSLPENKKTKVGSDSKLEFSGNLARWTSNWWGVFVFFCCANIYE